MIPLFHSRIQRFAGRFNVRSAKVSVIVGEGSRNERLTFVPVAGVGYVYVRGRGKVILHTGREISLGFTRECFEAVSSSRREMRGSWPPPELEREPRDSSSVEERANVDSENHTNIGGWDRGVYSNKSARSPLSLGFGGKVAVAWITSGDLHVPMRITDIEGPIPCYAENSFELLYSGDHGTGIRLQKSTSDRIAKVTYLGWGKGILDDPAPQELVLPWCEGTKVRFQGQAYDLRADGWYEGQKNVFQRGAIER